MTIPYDFGCALLILGILFPFLVEEGDGQDSINLCSSDLDSVTIRGKGM